MGQVKNKDGLAHLIETMYFVWWSINKFSSSILLSCLYDNSLSNVTNIKYQIMVSEFWIYWTFHLLSYLDLLGTFYFDLCITDGRFLLFQCLSQNFHYFFQTGGNRWTIVKNPLFWIYGIFQIFPEDLPKPS